MAEKFTYGPLVYNCFGDDDDSGNYWWPGNPPVGYEEETGPYRIPVDAEGNQCLPGESILHPNCRVEEFEYNETLEDDLPSLAWCRTWFEDNFLEIDNWTVCKYILRWQNHNFENSESWQIFKSRFTSVPELMEALWPDVHKS